MKFTKTRKCLAALLAMLMVLTLPSVGLASTAPDYPSGAAPDTSFSVRFIDVGQADAALVECDGHYMLVDGGNKADSSRIYTILKSEGVNYLDIVVGSHAHEDHIGGLPGAYSCAPAKLTLCPVTSYDSDAFRDFARYAEAAGGGITVPKPGDSYPFGSAVVTVLGVNGGSEPNDSSIILKVRYKNTSVLFTGDAEREAEQAVINSGADLSATVLKAGHHGSDTSTSYLFLRGVMPLYAVIPVGSGNGYGHPTDAVLSRLRDAGTTVLRTDLHGDITFASDGDTLTVSTAKSAPEGGALGAGQSGGDKSAAGAALSGGVGGPGAQGSAQTAAAPEPQGYDYIINANTKKFHYPNCRSVKQMKESNKRPYTGDRGELTAKGYSPCKNCNP